MTMMAVLILKINKESQLESTATSNEFQVEMIHDIVVSWPTVADVAYSRTA